MYGVRVCMYVGVFNENSNKMHKSGMFASPSRPLIFNISIMCILLTMYCCLPMDVCVWVYVIECLIKHMYKSGTFKNGASPSEPLTFIYFYTFALAISYLGE